MPRLIQYVLWTWFSCILMYGGTILFVFALVSIMT